MSCCNNDGVIAIKRAMAYDVSFKILDDDGNEYRLKDNEKLIFTVKKVKDIDVAPVIQKTWSESDYDDEDSISLNLYLSDTETDIDYGTYYYEFSRLVGEDHRPTNNYGRFEIVRTAAQKVGTS